MALANNDLLLSLYQELKKDYRGEIYKNEPMSRHTTFKVGGPASIFAIANSQEELRIVASMAQKTKTPLIVIGRGSNLLLSDQGYKGIVLRLGRHFGRINVDGEHIQAGAAATLPGLVQASYKAGLKSLAFAVGIPGNLGGALVLNAGAYGECIGNFVRKVTVYSLSGELKAYSGSQIVFGYRSSSLKNKGVILEATLKLEKGDMTSVKLKMERYFKGRKDSQPLNFASAGSVFKNPPDLFAGGLIEEAACKGWREGNAMVSEKHANFIVNLGNAKAADIYKLIERVKNRVFEEKGVLLEPEITFIGDFPA